MTEKESYSVLMSVYAKESPLFLSESIKSLFGQTHQTNDFVLVIDGPIGKELEEVIDYYSKVNPAILKVIRLEKNGGLGNALRIGLKECKNEYVMRADSDDVSLPERAEKSLLLMKRNGLDVMSSTVELIDSKTEEHLGYRNVPLSYKDIVFFSKRRCPFNHPSVFFKKTSVESVGGYKPLIYKEDYFLWVRMLQNGAVAENTPESLVKMRVDRSTIGRRKNKEALSSQKRLMKYMKETKYNNAIDRLISKAGFEFLYFAPSWLANYLYKRAWNSKK